VGILLKLSAEGLEASVVLRASADGQTGSYSEAILDLEEAF
jgi:hypothetical protein